MFINSRIANMMFRMRHGKGFLMLALVCYVETTTRTSAMSVWGRYQEWAQNRGANKGKNKTFNSKDNVRWSEDSCDLDDSSTVCSLSQSSERMYKRSRISKRVDGKENKNCPFDCSDCELLYSDSPYATKMVQKVSRGGEIKTQPVTAAGVVAETVSSQINPYGLHLNVWKIIFQACLTALNVFCWLAPLKNKKFSENKLGLSLANAFSGGVFLSLAFGHLLPECVHGFHGYNEALPFMIALGGYLLIFFVEKVAFDTQSLMESGEDNHAVDVKQNNGSSQNTEKSNPLGSGRSAVILLGALAVHSILEMTALGLADTFSDSALLSLSIALHQVRMFYILSSKYSFLFIIPLFTNYIFIAYCLISN